MQGGANTELIDKPVESNKDDKAGVVRVVEHGDLGNERWAALEAQMERIVELHAASGKPSADVFMGQLLELALEASRQQ